MIEFKIKIDEVMIGVYLNGNKGNIIFASGIPQYLDKYHPFVQQITRLGYNLFIPRYKGTYESNGQFNIKNSKDSIKLAIKLAKKGEGIELFANNKLKWSKENNYLIGFSYGALPALLQEEKVNKTILICPFISLLYHLPDSNGEDISQTFSFLERAYPNLYRFKSEDVLNDLQNIPLPKEKQNLIIIKGNNDKSIPKEELNYLKEKYNPLIYSKEGKHSVIMDDELLKKILYTK